MDPIRNPYAPGAGTPPPELAGRDELLDQVRVALERIRAGRSTKNLLMVGLRGVGKTVLLERMRNEAEEAVASRPFSSSPLKTGHCQPCWRHNFGRRCWRYRRTRVHGTRPGRALRALAGFVTALRVTYDDIEVHLDLEPELGLADNGDLDQDLPALLLAAGAAAKQARTVLSIFVDELQYVDEDGLAALTTALHHAAIRQSPVVLIGAGLPQLRARLGRAKSYAERLFDFPEVGALPPEAARRAIENPAQAQGVAVGNEALQRIVETTQGYPYFLQEWGKHAWNAADASPIDLDDVERASETAIATLDESFFRVRFDRLTEAERRYLRAMAELGPGPHRSGGIAEVLGRKIHVARTDEKSTD